MKRCVPHPGAQGIAGKRLLPHTILTSSSRPSPAEERPDEVRVLVWLKVVLRAHRYGAWIAGA